MELARENKLVTKERERVYLWDNLKFLLINLVVIGHFSDYFIEDSQDLQSIFFFIYIFHMPLFIFVTGLFSKSTIDGKRFKIERVMAYIILYVLIKYCFYWTENYILDENYDFTLFTSSGVPWYLLACALWLCITYILRDIKPCIVMAFSFIVGLFIGYDDKVEDFLCISRVLVYLPFFLAGYYLDQKKIIAFVKNRWVRVASVITIVIILITVICNIDSLYKFRPLLTGRNSFDSLENPDIGCYYRLIYYIVVVILSVSIMSIIPRKRIPIITVFGSRTLQVYFIHYFVMYYYCNSEVIVYIKQLWPAHWIVLYIVLAVMTTFVLSLKVFEYPFRKLLTMKYPWAHRKQ